MAVFQRKRRCKQLSSLRKRNNVSRTHLSVSSPSSASSFSASSSFLPSSVLMWSDFFKDSVAFFGFEASTFLRWIFRLLSSWISDDRRGIEIIFFTGETEADLEPNPNLWKNPCFSFSDLGEDFLDVKARSSVLSLMGFLKICDGLLGLRI